MSGSVHLTSIESLESLRTALRKFQDESVAVLRMISLTLHKALEWIDMDRPAYWKSQTRRAFDAVAAARTNLSTCQMRTVAGRRPSCIEERVAYEKAKRRLEFCQEQVERVKQWSVKLRHETDEFRGRLAALEKCLEGDVPGMTEALTRMLTVLWEYTEQTSPTETRQESHPVHEPPGVQPSSGGATS